MFVCFGESGVDIHFNSEADKMQRASCVSETSAFTLCKERFSETSTFTLCVCVCVCFGESVVDRHFNSEADKMQQTLHVSEMSAFTLCEGKFSETSTFPLCVCLCLFWRECGCEADTMQQALHVSEMSAFTLCVCLC